MRHGWPHERTSGNELLLGFIQTVLSSISVTKERMEVYLSNMDMEK
jgi:hypothetical protein